MLIRFKERAPSLGERCYIAETAAVIGDVTLGDDVSVWFGASVRGDSSPITVGAGANRENARLYVEKKEAYRKGETA